jgi:GH24 family phage-related lysozyme (muramidase)
MNKEILKEQIKRHEGEVLEIYEDSLGYLTFGVGHLIKDSDDEF